MDSPMQVGVIAGYCGRGPEFQCLIYMDTAGVDQLCSTPFSYES